ncbi:MAG: aminoacetone oxidase family FAD-binding enzyme [Spirochaetes bacterium]|nr:aminoacetone oxidase family FAD-binding enzyme [Spirochaetota bacterium]
MIKVGVIGAGASGMLSAVFAAEECLVTVFEKNDRPLKKVTASGNGQCNISNQKIETLNYHGDSDFAMKVISHFGINSVRDYFDDLGIPFAEGKNGKLFPFSFQSSSVVEALLFDAQRKNVCIKTHSRISRIKKIKDKFELMLDNKEVHDFDKIIIASGGCSYPSLGGTSDGYELCSSIGHNVINPFPAVVPVNIPLKKIHRLEGIKWNCALKVISCGKELKRAEGEILFTKYGFSGPVTLDVSRHVNDPDIKNTEIEVDLFPSVHKKELVGMLQKIFSIRGRSVSAALDGILKKRMGQVFLELGSFDSAREAFSYLGRCSEICSLLKASRFTAGEPRGFADSVVAAGGVDCSSVNPFTMESKKTRGVHITGELLNVDGDTGGFNLHFAWASGALAGKAVRPLK